MSLKKETHKKKTLATFEQVKSCLYVSPFLACYLIGKNYLTVATQKVAYKWLLKSLLHAIVVVLLIGYFFSQTLLGPIFALMSYHILLRLRRRFSNNVLNSNELSKLAVNEILFLLLGLLLMTVVGMAINIFPMAMYIFHLLLIFLTSFIVGSVTLMEFNSFNAHLPKAQSGMIQEKIKCYLCGEEFNYFSNGCNCSEPSFSGFNKYSRNKIIIIGSFLYIIQLLVVLGIIIYFHGQV